MTDAGWAPSTETLGRKVRRGAAWSTAEVAVARFGQFAQGVVMAHLLAPSVFGIFAVALVVHSVVVNVGELGVSVALIRDDAEDARRGAPTVATIAIVSSCVLGALMALSAPWLAGLLGSSEATSAVAVMALTLPLAGITAVPSAFVRRDFHMERLFFASAANMVATAVVVIVLALAGWGAMALAWSWVAGQLLTTIVLLTYRPGRVRPGWDRHQAGRLLRFGLPLAGASLLAFTVLNVDFVVVGRVLGTEALGLYVLAFNISGWPMNVFGAVVRSVSLPGFAHLRRDGAAMPGEYTKALGLVATIVLPICAILGALAFPLVVAVYGEEWAAAGAALAGLSALGAARILIELTADFLVTLGRTRAVLLAQVAWLFGLTAGLIVLVSGHGLAGAGIAQAAVSVGLMMPIYLVLLRRAGVPALGVARAVLPPLMWSLVAAGLAWVVAEPIANPFLATAAGAVAGLALYTLAHRRLVLDGLDAWRRERGDRDDGGPRDAGGGPGGPEGPEPPDRGEGGPTVAASPPSSDPDLEAVAIGGLVPGSPVEIGIGPA